jgi:hypothetical protein
VILDVVEVLRGVGSLLGKFTELIHAAEEGCCPIKARMFQSPTAAHDHAN